MNCHEFRHAWDDITDPEMLSHIETCEECMVWIEAQLAIGEEVQFLKEIPQPSAQLEDKIMQAIYQTAGQGMTPQAAAAPALTEVTQAKPRRFIFTKPAMTWASAAAILLFAGVLGYQQLQQDNQEVAVEHGSLAMEGIASAPAPAAQQATALDNPNESVSNQAIAETAPAAGSADSTLSSAAEPGAEIAGSHETAAKDSGTEQNQAAQEAGQAFSIAMAPKVPAAAESETSAAAEPKRPIIAARNANGKPATEQPKAAAPGPTPALSNEAHSIAALPPGDQQETSLADQRMNSLAAEEHQTVEQAPALVGPPVMTMAKPEITLSSFTDVATAAHASDMPVPEAGKLPEGFALHAITAQYESQTSQKVVRLTTEYKRNRDWIKVEVVRNEHGKRSLSIPGTFTATQLFTVQSEQAIGVTFDKQASADSEAAADHAVHFNADPENQSLYVVITASGISLEQLVEASKQVSWH